MTPGLLDRPVPRRAQQPQLALAADQRRVQVTRRGPARSRIDRHQPKRAHRLGLALQRQRLERLDLAPRRERAAASPRPSRISPGAAACSSRAATFTASPIARFSPSPTSTRPVFTAGAETQRDAHLLGHRRQPLADLGRRPHRPQRVVLMHLRDPEHRHHRVADELLHRPAMALDQSRRNSR